MHVGIFAFNLEISVKHLKFIILYPVDFINQVVPHKLLIPVMIITLHNPQRSHLLIYEMNVLTRKITTQIRTSEILVVL